MLPVVRGIPATNRKIMLYSVILVALTVAFIQVGSMGLIYTAAAVLLGAWFLTEAWVMWRSGSATRAIRLYRVSITYLSALFAAIALDALLTIRL